MLVKRDGTRQAYDRQKLLNGLMKACEKRPVSLSCSSSRSWIMWSRRCSARSRARYPARSSENWSWSSSGKVDEVAYVRFASVYRQFKDINTFMEELNTLIKDK